MSEALRCPHCDAATRANPHGLHVEAGVSVDYAPFVHLAWRKERLQATPEEARSLATSILEVAMAAEYEAAFMRWVRDTLQIDHEHAALVLTELRRYFTLAEERTSGGRTAL